MLVMSQLIPWLVMRWSYVALAALIALAGVQQLRVSDARMRTAQAERRLSDHQATQAHLAQLAEAAARAEEARMESEKERVSREARQQIDAARAATVSAARAADGLRDRLTRLVATSRRAAAAAEPACRGASESGADAARVLAGLLERADQRAGILAAHATAIGIAAATCERFADSLTTPTQP